MKLFLMLKHWQLFALLIGPILILQFFLFGMVQPGNSMQGFLIVLALMMLLFMGGFFSWLYALGTGLYRQLPASVSMNINRFKIACFLPLIYITLMLAYLLALTSGAAREVGRAVFVLIIPLHLLSMAGIFYCLYFNAKSLKAVELQHPVELSDCLGELFMIWFFPIGIWIIQPRVNIIFNTPPTATL